MSKHSKPSREVTFDGRTIVNTSDLLNDPDVKRTLELLTQKIKSGRRNARLSRPVAARTSD